MATAEIKAGSLTSIGTTEVSIYGRISDLMEEYLICPGKQ